MPTKDKNKKPLTRIDKEIAEMDAYVKKIASSKKKSIAFLKRAGILNKKGKLAKQYRNKTPLTK
jgi:hypothetical protein